MLRFVKTVMECNGVVEDATKCVKVINGICAHTAAFVPDNHLSLSELRRHKFAQVDELHCDSEASRSNPKPLPMMALHWSDFLTRMMVSMDEAHCRCRLANQDCQERLPCTSKDTCVSQMPLFSLSCLWLAVPLTKA